MKKRILAIVLVLMLALTLLPTVAFATEGSTSPEIIYRNCPTCNKNTNHEILGYSPNGSGGPSDSAHYMIRRCKECGVENIVVDSEGKYSEHVPLDGREPTCTTGRICAKCKLEYGKLGHDWSAWQSNGDSKTHTRTCKRTGCDAVDTANYGGDSTATCVTPGICTGCGQQYYTGHSFPSRWKWDSDTDVGRDAESHWLRCLNCTEGKTYEGAHSFVQGTSDSCLKSKATCISPPVYYENCSTCHYKGTNTYLHPWYGTDPKNHEGGTEVKDAKAASCTEKGYTGDTYCKGCGVKLSDGKDIPATGHDWVDATCTTPKTCKVCKATEGNALGHTGGTANCHTKAVCEVCKEAYGEFDATNHDGGTEIKDAKDATCTEKGYIGDTYCKGCNAKLFDGKDIPAAGHKLTHVAAKNPTSFVVGNIEYWYCTVCGKYFRDAAATQEITKEDTVTYKESAPVQDNKTVKSSKTGDAGVMLYAGMAVLSLTGCAWLRRKEK